VLSGDVHHSYLARARWSGDGTASAAPVHQVTCSPLHNAVPRAMRAAFRLAWSRAAERGTRMVLARTAAVPKASLRWRRTAGPYFGNAVATLLLDGRTATLTLETSEDVGDDAPLRLLVARDLSG
jgi:hypothetical protein